MVVFPPHTTTEPKPCQPRTSTHCPTLRSPSPLTAQTKTSSQPSSFSSVHAMSGRHGSASSRSSASTDTIIHPIPVPRLADPKAVTVLCAARSSVYNSIPGLLVFDRAKDAWSAHPCGPVVAHPPCRCWSRSWARSRCTVFERIAEMLLGMECVRLVLRNGGILEHPAFSRLWACAKLPRPGRSPDAKRTWSIAIDQQNFGHRVSKPTWLLFSGVDPWSIQWDEFTLALTPNRTLDGLTPGQRSSTPLAFARWLVSVAQRAAVPRPQGQTPLVS